MKAHEKKLIQKKLDSFRDINESTMYFQTLDLKTLKNFAHVLNTPVYNSYFNDSKSTESDLIDDINSVLWG